MEHQCHVLSIVSLKGGVGKTTTAVNLGAALAREFGQKVILIDTNYGAPNLGIHLGIVEPPHNIQNVILDKTSLPEAILRHKQGFDLIAASLNPIPVDPLLLKTKLEPLKKTYNFIILDTAPNMDDPSFLSLADSVLVITTPDYPTLSCTMRAVKEAKQLNTPIIGLLLNKVHNKTFEITLEEIEEATTTPVLAVIPHNTLLLETLAQTTSAISTKPLSKVSIEYKHLAASLTGTTYKDPRLITLIKRIFPKKIRKEEVNRELLRVHFSSSQAHTRNETTKLSHE